MNFKSKTMLVGLITAAVVLSGCSKTKEVMVSEDVKTYAQGKEDNNKPKTEPVLKEKLNIAENQYVLGWIDDENLLTQKCSKDEMVLYSYNLESQKSTEILNDKNITEIYGYDSNGVLLVGNNKQAFKYDLKDKKLQEVINLDKESKDEYLCDYQLRLVNKDYISYVDNRKADYTVLNFKENKKYTIESSAGLCVTDCKIDPQGKNAYIGEGDKLTKLNLETDEKSIIQLKTVSILGVSDDGTLLVRAIDENGPQFDKTRVFKVDFNNNKVNKYEQNFGGEDLLINSIDANNGFVTLMYQGEGEDGTKNGAMYGKLGDNKIIITDKLFKNNEDIVDNSKISFTFYIYSPNHDKFIARINISDKYIQVTEAVEECYGKTDNYLFELK